MIPKVLFRLFMAGREHAHTSALSLLLLHGTLEAVTAPPCRRMVV